MHESAQGHSRQEELGESLEVEGPDGLIEAVKKKETLPPRGRKARTEC